eukprot:c47912_g1_i1.p2 GENE.c47912_g1_i1~~c47912_g1_i1.p2  ORF type:complete len:113 (+),score=18.93 c47912_g1_i1:41-340(+)
MADLAAFEARAVAAERKIAELTEALSKGGNAGEAVDVDALTAENARLKYQITHLLRSLNAEEEKRVEERAESDAKVARLEYQVLHLIRNLDIEEAKNRK